MDSRDVLIGQLKLMADRIVEEGKRIPGEPLVMEYDNGGGQTGVRENPFYPAYEKLLTSYTRTLAAAKDIAGDADAEVINLESIRSKFKVAK